MDQLDQQRERVLSDLRGLVRGEVRCDDVFLHLYASDASVWEVRPLAVVRPRSTADVVACVQYAAQERIPVHARGAGSNSAGSAIGSGIVLDFSRYFRRIIRIEDSQVRVQPGVVLERLGAQLRAFGRGFGPDPANALVATVGGVIGVDAAGSRWLRYGSTRAHVRSLQVVLSDGQVIEVGREPIAAENAENAEAPPSRKQELVTKLHQLLATHALLVEQHNASGPGRLCGYGLADVISDGHLDVGKLMTGSEGTLGLITEATLDVQRLPRSAGLALLMFDSLEKASRAIQEILPRRPSACDLMDRRRVSLAREADPRLELLIPVEAEAVLLVEQQGEETRAVRAWIQELIEVVGQRQRLAFMARQTFDREEMQLFWSLVSRIQPALYRVKGPTRPLPIMDDLRVEPARLPAFVVRLQNLLKRHQVTASLLYHAGRGHLHLQPFLNLDDPQDVIRLRPLVSDLCQEVFDAGGAIGGNSGLGLSRSWLVKRQAGPLHEVFRAVKQIFDPAGVLNPGKILTDDIDLPSVSLRPSIHGAVSPASLDADAASADEDEVTMRDLTELQLNWEPSRVVDATMDCNRCGDCRTQAHSQRMCPLFRFMHAEEASPRAKANLLRGVLSGQLPLGRLTSDELKQVADLCVHCHSCRFECPTRVDVPRLMREVKGAYVTVNGLRLPQWVVTHLNVVAGLAGVASPATNWALGNRFMRWLMEKTLGIAQGRKLPRVTSRNFLRRAARRRMTRPTRRQGRKVAYFVDVYANYFDPQLAEALVGILKRNGISVYVPPDQVQAGMPSIALGSLQHARALARQNVSVLAEAVRQGYHVVATEPSAALCLTREYPQLVDDDDARLVAANSSEACTYLWNLHTTGDLQLDFRPISAAAGYHLPCHLRALEVGSPGESLLRLIPGLRIYRIEEGCSGMAGTYGLLRQNYRSSLRAGWPLIGRLRDQRLQLNCTECSTCKLQMEQGTTKPTIHPLKLLAIAYGVLSEANVLANLQGGELLAT